MTKTTATHPLALLPPPPAASPTARPPGPCRRRLPEAMGGASGRPRSHVSKHWPAVADRAKGYSCCVSNARSDHVSRGGLLGSVFVLGVPGENEAGFIQLLPADFSLHHVRELLGGSLGASCSVWKLVHEARHWRAAKNAAC